MKSHKGELMSIGEGCTYMPLSKKKLNTKSPTEAELIAIDDDTRHFLAAQGVHVPTMTFYQDICL